MKLAKEEIKTATIITLLFIVAFLAVQVFYVHPLIMGSIKPTYESMNKYNQYRFSTETGYIDDLENNNINDVLYQLYESVKSNIECNDSDEVSCIPSSRHKEFIKRYEAYMQQECNNNCTYACISYGKTMTAQKRFDLAEKSYLKAAESGNRTAMSRLYYLYSNEQWSGYSEEKATYWLYQIRD
ncbi:hypothetical protein QWI17_02130 [Gilvimarinus sp. SDUM040013]|uniref:Sel1 repeat family protein n=1 Tax=Gilvimarinus gilvus TaxID=3058038 RepID=A0ABU4RZ75_9GAMM|nr:hypothetical protein [Gilvimarinus sp. SDUM040013]MDO3384629.1 hypothetical protein [Gilvimarinus sp. SDUM040013]MDX6850215.1 hypothetical protein [Gilvimarinus sp. SDUM040013]